VLPNLASRGCRSSPAPPALASQSPGRLVAAVFTGRRLPRGVVRQPHGDHRGHQGRHDPALRPAPAPGSRLTKVSHSSPPTPLHLPHLRNEALISPGRPGLRDHGRPRPTTGLPTHAAACGLSLTEQLLPPATVGGMAGLWQASPALELMVMVDTPGLQPGRRPRDRAAGQDGQATPGDPAPRRGDHRQRRLDLPLLRYQPPDLLRPRPRRAPGPLPPAPGQPQRHPTEIVGKIIYLCQHYHFGPAKIAMYLRRDHDITISPPACGAS
jgi:hypothetical protein